jgi:aminoglycoside phosphotransferase (APT) family kinase protein
MISLNEPSAPEPDLLEAARAAVRAAGRPGSNLTSRWFTEGRAIFFQGRPVPPVFVKVYRQASALAHEVAMLDRAASVGIPIPSRMLFQAGPPAVFITRMVDGVRLSSDYPVAAEETGRLLRLFHALGASPPFSGGQSRWEDFVCWWADREIDAAVERGMIAVDDGHRLSRHFSDVRPLLADRPCVLTIGDFQAEHVLIDPATQRVNAFLDFVDVQPGDPLIDVSVLTLWDVPLAAPVLRGYGIDPVEAEALLPTYRLLRYLAAAVWLHDRRVEPWARRCIEAVRQFLSGP